MHLNCSSRLDCIALSCTKQSKTEPPSELRQGRSCLQQSDLSKRQIGGRRGNAQSFLRDGINGDLVTSQDCELRAVRRQRVTVTARGRRSDPHTEQPFAVRCTIDLQVLGGQIRRAERISRQHGCTRLHGFHNEGLPVRAAFGGVAAIIRVQATFQRQFPGSSSEPGTRAPWFACRSSPRG